MFIVLLSLLLDKDGITTIALGIRLWVFIDFKINTFL